ncbi:sodium/calcium exchanger 3 isoform X2 [Dermacentor andersoni]|uniref:sodium/calcium exchanger 3 isoform X2 n=1 Tax=Dermacentor andersoni TaxID=34620 RepID=UPI002155B77E|nr:sodium/calcium exchanger 3-like isoform X2 [Dermacentor andersoni]
MASPRFRSGNAMLASLALLLLSSRAFGTAGATSEVSDDGGGGGSGNGTQGPQCKDGLILPVWMPQENISTGDVVARGLVYFLALAYMFIGISIIADRFMAAIEVITSKEKEVTIKKPNGETQTISVRVWNETVSNLTLMALGSSAPEILLSVIEIYAQNFEAGDLGPGTIVGSAAFNMFVIIAICVYSIPPNEVRRIKHLRVFFVTMTWSVFAYIWLYIIITYSSWGVIEVWEGAVTFMFFPATVLTAYIADRRLLIYKYLSKKYRVTKRGVIVGSEGEDVEMGPSKERLADGILGAGTVRLFGEEQSAQAKEFEEHRKEYTQILRELRHKNPDASMHELESMARDEIIARCPKSRAYYRIQATRKLMGAGNLIRRKADLRGDAGAKDEGKEEKVEEEYVRLFFDPGHYTVFENVGEFAVTVAREGGDPQSTVCVDYNTEDGTANAESDYVPVEGTLVFRPGETQKQIIIKVIDDDVFEEDEHFYVRLSNPRYLGSGGSGAAMNGSPGQPQPPGLTTGAGRPPVKLDTPSVCTVMILDDDHSGVFSLPESQVEISEAVGEYHIKVNRFSGARGRVFLPYKAIEGTAKMNKDFEPCEGTLVFENNETSQEFSLYVIDNESYEKDAVLYIELGEPKLEEDLLREHGVDEVPEVELTEAQKIALMGRPRLGDQCRCTVRIKESKEFKNTVDKLFQRANISLMIGTSSWKEQFVEAITVVADDDRNKFKTEEAFEMENISLKFGKDDDEENGEEGDEVTVRMPSCSDYVMHVFTVFWKVLFAFVPPTDYWGGWACFVTSILLIGVLTAFVGDLASHFGCTIGLKDSVTAISLVALGTSIPDTFASKVAAQNDKYADSSIGNVTGSNAVNVFLGIGVAWSLAALVHWGRGTTFEVLPGNLAFSVTIFCVCALLCCVVLLMRRNKIVGGELGGPMRFKLPTTILFGGLWVFYVTMSALEAYGVIQGF